MRKGALAEVSWMKENFMFHFIELAMHYTTSVIPFLSEIPCSLSARPSSKHLPLTAHLNFTTILQSRRCHSFHCADEEAEVK